MFEQRRYTHRMAGRQERLAATPKEPVGLALQPVLSDRVNVLLGWARASSRPAWNRRDVVAALIYASPDSPETFEDLIKRYEEATVADARLPGQRAALAPIKHPGRIPRARKT
jgi:hypothetical protein